MKDRAVAAAEHLTPVSHPPTLCWTVTYYHTVNGGGQTLGTATSNQVGEEMKTNYPGVKRQVKLVFHVHKLITLHTTWCINLQRVTLLQVMLSWAEHLLVCLSVYHRLNSLVSTLLNIRLFCLTWCSAVHSDRRRERENTVTVSLLRLKGTMSCFSEGAHRSDSR